MSNLGHKFNLLFQSFWDTHKDMFNKDLQALLSLYQLTKNIVIFWDDSSSLINTLNELKSNNISRDLEIAQNSYRENTQDYPEWSLYKGFYSIKFAFNNLKALTKPLLLGDKAYQKSMSATKDFSTIAELLYDFYTKLSEAADATCGTISSDVKYMYCQIQTAIYGHSHCLIDEEPTHDLSDCCIDSTFHDSRTDIIGALPAAAA